MGSSSKSGLSARSLSITQNKGSFKAHQRNTKRRARTRKIVAELVEEAKLYEASDDLHRDTTSVIEAMQLMLDRGMALYRLSAKEADKLTLDEMWSESEDEIGNTVIVPSKWVQFEAAMRSEVFEMAARMQGLNVDERLVKIEEAKVELLGRALQAAARAIGLDEDKQKELGAALRDELATVEGTATEVSAPTRTEKAA